jgi:hypothetical protein
MWLVAHKSILTKYNMLRRKWQETPDCYFFGEAETTGHMIGRPIAKVIWGIVAICFGQNDRSSSYEQFSSWIKKALLGGDGGDAGVGSYLLVNLERAEQNMFRQKNLLGILVT